MPWVRFNPDTFRGEEWEGPKKPDFEDCKEDFTITPRNCSKNANFVVAGFLKTSNICNTRIRECQSARGNTDE